jgi:hypothetical protein
MKFLSRIKYWIILHPKSISSISTRLGGNVDGRHVALCESTSCRSRGVHSRIWRASRWYGISIELSLYNWEGNLKFDVVDFDDSVVVCRAQRRRSTFIGRETATW